MLRWNGQPWDRWSQSWKHGQFTPRGMTFDTINDIYVLEKQNIYNSGLFLFPHFENGKKREWQYYFITDPLSTSQTIYCQFLQMLLYEQGRNPLIYFSIR